MKVAFLHGCYGCAVIWMASKRDVLFATQYYGTYNCSKQVHISVKHPLFLRGNSYMTRFSLVFEHFELAQRWCQVPSGDIVFSDDAQVLHLY